MKNIKRISAVILCLLTVMLLLPTTAFAAGPIDTAAEANLTLTLTPDGNPVEGLEFRLYRVAEVSSSVEFTLTEKFANYPISVTAPTEESWRYLTAILPGYIAADQVKPDYTKKTDEDGVAAFENISTGLYLVMGDVYHGYRQFITPTPFLVSLPNRNDDDTWTYSVSVANKYTSKPDSEDVDIEVLKVWNDNKNSDRPKEVTIELYDGNTLYETVVLNKSNNWQHKWTNLYGGTTWSIKEREVPEGYTVSIEQQGNRFVVTNTKPCPPSKTPEKLPQTGVLWWPVPVLLVCGLMLVLMGLIRRRGNRYEK